MYKNEDYFAWVNFRCIMFKTDILTDKPELKEERQSQSSKITFCSCLNCFGPKMDKNPFNVSRTIFSQHSYS